RLGAAAREVDAGEPGREPDELAGQPLLGRARELLVVDEAEPPQLGRRGSDHFGGAGPERRHHRAAADRVEIAVAVGIDEPHALAALDQRIAAVELAVEDGRAVGVDEDGVDALAHARSIVANAVAAVKPGRARASASARGTRPGRRSPR